MSDPDLPSRYTILSLLGEGGAGRVYRVLDRLAGTEVALKVVGEAESSFLKREFETLRQVRHNNLVEVKEWSLMASGHAYYTMELIDGQDLGRNVGIRVPHEEVRRILGGVLRGLAHLHSHQEIHGDLKPSNILQGRRGLIKVTDVGMGTAADRTRSVTGTPGYTAPEVWMGSSGDERSDIYSVGVIAYEALTGSHPFLGRTVRDVLAGQMEGWVPSLSSHGVAIPSDLERAVMRALERDASLRHQSADELMDELGLSDKIGEILGGQFVDRDRELRDLDSLMGSQSEPTLVWIYGPPGSGRLTLVREWCHRVAKKGSITLELDFGRRLPEETLLSGLLNQVSNASIGTPTGSGQVTLSSVAHTLATACQSAPLSIICDSRTQPLDDVMPFARKLIGHIHADGTKKPLMLFVLTDAPPQELREFEKAVTPSVLGIRDVGSFVQGLFGTLEWDEGAINRLHRLTGGVPGLLKAVLLQLAADGILERSAGRWRFRETQPIDTLGIKSLRGSVAQSWDELGDVERVALLTLAITQSSLHESVLVSTFGSQVLSALRQNAQRGWVVNTDGNWTLLSELVRTHVLAVSEGPQRIAAAKAVLSHNSSRLSRECLADLMLLAGEPAEACAIALDAARLASERGQHAVAEDRLRAILSVGRDVLDGPGTADVVLKLAAELNLQGKHAAAVAVLSDTNLWGHVASPSIHFANRAHLMGQLYRTLGDIDRARGWLNQASSAARTIGELATWLRAQADLSQIDWELGTERDRADAIARIKQVLAETEGVNGIRDERASLLYGYGAALIVSGDRRAGKEVLLGAIQAGCSEYWKMRMANALVSATTLLGEYQESVAWSDEAWLWAERAGVDSFKARILSNRGALFHSMGRYRESADQDMLAVEWAERIGNTFEYESGLAGAAINNILLAQYETALGQAKQGQLLARRSRNELNAAKTAELEALVQYYVGDLDAALGAVNEGCRVLAGHEYVETRPRLDWLRGRIMVEHDEIGAAIELLTKAEQGLLQCTDLEDLLGIQVELNYVKGLGSDWRAALERIEKLTLTAEKAGVFLARLSGAVAVGEIVAEFCAEERQFDDLLRGALAQADSSGVLEASWQLDGSLGLIGRARGERRAAHASINRAVRTIREISERLEPGRRQLYLHSRRVRRRLTAFSSAI